MSIKAIGRYKITYKNGFIQEKNMISFDDYAGIYKPSMIKMTDIESSDAPKKERDEKINKIKDKMKFLFGSDWFTSTSPLSLAIETGVLSLHLHQGGDHKIKLEKICVVE